MTMKLETLRNALRYYAISAECDDVEREYVFDALEEIARTIERYDDREFWKSAAVVIPQPTLIDLLNELTYDDYGRLARARNNNLSFDVYAYNIREGHLPSISYLTNEQLHDGYDLINDLWHDNENSGDNNADGTFRRN